MPEFGENTPRPRLDKGETAAPDCPRPVFSLEKVSFSYGSRKVLDNLDFSLWPGQCAGLAGANGSGKTTFFRCITGLARPQAGNVLFQGAVLRHEKDFQGLRKTVGYVLQDSGDQLFFPSVGEDLAFGPLNMGMSAKDAREAVRESLAFVGLTGFEERLTHELSGGEKKLVAIAAILAMRPRALLLDEPLNELDENAAARVEWIITSLDCAKIIVSHDHAFLERCCDGIYRMSAGKIWPINDACATSGCP